VAHRARAPHRASEPVHVTLRSEVSSLRSQFTFPTVRAVIADANRRGRGFRIVHFSVQGDHVHLIVEATDRARLVAALKGVSVSLARRVNRLIFRRGRLIADRWHGRALETPRAVRHAIAYVLGNFRKHGKATHAVDPCSSAPYFDGFAECAGKRPLEVAPRSVPREFRSLDPPTAEPKTWLLRVGWRRHGRISMHTSPSVRPQRSR
jgi:REP element-mobilizing transposase RayT